MLKSDLESSVVWVRYLALRPSQSDGIPPCSLSELLLLTTLRQLTHERSPILQIHFIMRDAVTCQVVTCEIESVRCPQVILVCQLD